MCGRCQQIELDYHGVTGVTKKQFGVGVVPRFQANHFIIVSFQVFALTVFARESRVSSIHNPRENSLSYLLANLIKEHLAAEEQVAQMWGAPGRRQLGSETSLSDVLASLIKEHLAAEEQVAQPPRSPTYSGSHFPPFSHYAEKQVAGGRRN